MARRLTLNIWLTAATVLGLFFFGCSKEAAAQDSLCRIPDSQTPELIQEVRGPIRLQSGKLIETCYGKSDGKLVSVVIQSAIYHTPMGVCGYATTRFYRTRSPANTGWHYRDQRSQEDRNFFMILDNACANGDIEKFVRVTNVSIRSFAKLAKFWKQLFSDGKMGELISDLETTDLGDPQNNQLFDNLKDILRNRAQERRPIVLAAIELDTSFPVQGPRYAMRFRDGATWSILVDFEGDEVRAAGWGWTK